MQHHIIISTIGRFAKAATKAIETTEHALVLGDVSLDENRLTALFTSDPSVSARGSRALMELQVVSGSADAVAAEIAEAVAANPYVKPLKVFSRLVKKPAKKKAKAAEDEPDKAAEGVAGGEKTDLEKGHSKAADPAAEEPKDDEAEDAGEPGITVIAILGVYQP